MPVEIEAKMRLVDRGVVERRLRDAGAASGPVILETNIFFDTDGGALKSTDQGLRIRVMQVKRGDTSESEMTVVLTHKGPRAHGKLKSREEHELVVKDAAAAEALLGALGYTRVMSFDKRRERWTLDGCTVDLDTLPHLGEFVEIEGPSDTAVLAVRQKLALTDAPLIRASYIAMLDTYVTEHHLRRDHVKLPH
jgi:predicted adenylyl cyclase CyaB